MNFLNSARNCGLTLYLNTTPDLERHAVTMLCTESWLAMTSVSVHQHEPKIEKSSSRREAKARSLIRLCFVFELKNSESVVH